MKRCRGVSWNNSDGAMHPRARVAGSGRLSNDERRRIAQQGLSVALPWLQAMFTVRTGTIFEERRLPLRVWVYAFWRACSEQERHQRVAAFTRDGNHHKSALFVLRRIRHGLGSENAPKLTGTVEADETYIGGKPRFSSAQARAPTRRQSGGARHGPARRRCPVPPDGSHHLKPSGEVIAENADLTCRLITDEHAGIPASAGIPGRSRDGDHTAENTCGGTTSQQYD